MRSRHERTYPVSVEHGWDYINDVSRWPQWYSGLLQIHHPESASWERPGDQVHWSYRLLGRTLQGSVVLVRMAPPRLVSLRSHIQRLPDVLWEYRFEDAGPRAFTLTIVMETPEVATFFGRSIDSVLVPRLLERELDASLENLDNLFSTGVYLTGGGAETVERHAEPARVLSLRRVAAIMFTDIVDSTRQAQKLGEEHWAAVMELHGTITRATVERYEGRYVKSTGDGILATFEGPGLAIDAAVELRRRLAEAGLDTRIGIHVGEIQTHPEDIGGMAVHIGSRVMTAATPGEILVSRTARDMLIGSRHELADRGSHRLRGLEGVWHLYAVVDRAPRRAPITEDRRISSPPRASDLR